MTVSIKITKYGREIRRGDQITHGAITGQVAAVFHQPTRSHIWLAGGHFIQVNCNATVRVDITPLVDTRLRIPG